jgi:hypothetical protein
VWSHESSVEVEEVEDPETPEPEETSVDKNIHSSPNEEECDSMLLYHVP